MSVYSVKNIKEQSLNLEKIDFQMPEGENVDPTLFNCKEINNAINASQQQFNFE